MHIRALLIEDNPDHAELVKQMPVNVDGKISFDLEWGDGLLTGIKHLEKGSLLV